MARLIIQIPCLNEEEHLPVTLMALPSSFEGIDEVLVMVVNDGSTDRTVEVAQQQGVDIVLDLKTNRGLADTFMAGLRLATRLKADYLVNLDADNQYCAEDIPLLLAPLQAGEVDMVVGERPIADIAHFSPVKKKLQAFGSWLVRKLSGTTVRDTPSGFRALNRKAMLNMVIHNRYTYTHESLLAARELKLRVKGVPIRVNSKVLRPSRLMKSTVQYLLKSGLTISRFYMLYNPLVFFLGVALLFLLGGTTTLALGLCGGGTLATLPVFHGMLAGVCFTSAVVSLLVSVVCSVLQLNRRMLQVMVGELRRIDTIPLPSPREGTLVFTEE